LRTRAIPERLSGEFTTRCYTNSRLPLPLPSTCMVDQTRLDKMMATVDVDDSSLQVDSQPKSSGWSEGRQHWELLYIINQINRVNSCNDFVITTAP